jgi:hypothetical protein
MRKFIGQGWDEGQKSETYDHVLLDREQSCINFRDGTIRLSITFVEWVPSHIKVVIIKV